MIRGLEAWCNRGSCSMICQCNAEGFVGLEEFEGEDCQDGVEELVVVRADADCEYESDTGLQ
jgi:hypothetical protein